MTELSGVEVAVVGRGDPECGPELQQCHNEVTQLRKLGRVVFTLRPICLLVHFNCTGACHLIWVQQKVPFEVR